MLDFGDVGYTRTPWATTKYLRDTAVPRCADVTVTILTNAISIGAMMKRCTATTTDRTLIAAPKLTTLAASLLLAGIGAAPFAAYAATPNPASNPACPVEAVFYNPGNGEDIVVPSGYNVSVFAKDLNFPTAVAFKGDKNHFEVYVLESGHGLPSRCNDETLPVFGGEFSASNPMTPDILVFDQAGNKIGGPLAKPTPSGGGLQPHGPAIDIAFERGFHGGRLFATDSNQSLRGAGNNNSSRIVTVDPNSGLVTPFITGLPTGDHPAEQITFQGGWIYWSQGSTANSGVVGHDNNGGLNQQDIPCQTITLSQNVFDSGDGDLTSGYSPHGVARPGATIPAFDSATGPGICDGAILRAKVNATNPKATIEPFSWGYRNPFGIRFAPNGHPLKGGLLVTENGEDERGARPVNNAPDRLALAQQNKDGSPDYHGWPDRFGFLDSTQAVFNPVGGPGDDCIPCSVNQPVRPVLAFPPQPITAPLALEPANVAAVGLDFVPDSFVTGPVRKGAALVSREGDFGFSAANGDPEAGHDIELVNFSGPPLQLQQTRFAYNTTFEQAFVGGLHGINRPVDLKFGPDDCAYLVDYGAVRDFGQSDPLSKFIDPLDAPLVQIPGTGVIWKICKQ
jgi:glucose/arabinose dehydrogenase